MNQWSWFECVKKPSKIKIEYNSYNISYDIEYAVMASISIPPPSLQLQANCHGDQQEEEEEEE